MNLYLLKRTDKWDYDQYDSAVVAAESENEAKKIHPDGSDIIVSEEANRWDSWVSVDRVECQLIGVAEPLTNRGVICSSFNAG